MPQSRSVSIRGRCGNFSTDQGQRANGRCLRVACHLPDNAGDYRQQSQHESITDVSTGSRRSLPYVRSLALDQSWNRLIIVTRRTECFLHTTDGCSAVLRKVYSTGSRSQTESVCSPSMTTLIPWMRLWTTFRVSVAAVRAPSRVSRSSLCKTALISLSPRIFFTNLTALFSVR